MKSKLDFSISTDTKCGSAVLSLMGDDLAAVMDALHDAVVEFGRWADIPPAAILATIISVIAVEEDEARKAAGSLGGQEKGGDRDVGPSNMQSGPGPAHNAGEGTGDADEKG